MRVVSTSVYSMDSNTFATWLRRQLNRNEWTQADFARRMDVSTGRISEWTTGKRVPNPKSCELIADVLGADIDLVLRVAGHRPNVESIDPDDPRVILHGMIDRVVWTEDRLDSITAQLDTMLKRDRATKAAAGAVVKVARGESSE
jgi:transcriptional regulator with XRE-family HTH domain